MATDIAYTPCTDGSTRGSRAGGGLGVSGFRLPRSSGRPCSSNSYVAREFLRRPACANKHKGVQLTSRCCIRIGLPGRKSVQIERGPGRGLSQAPQSRVTEEGAFDEWVQGGGPARRIPFFICYFLPVSRFHGPVPGPASPGPGGPGTGTGTVKA